MDATYLAQDVNRLKIAVDAAESSALATLLRECQDCEARGRRLAQREIVAEVLIQRSRILLRQQRIAEAVASLSEAERGLDGPRASGMKVRILLAEACCAKYKWKLASAVCEEGIGVVEEQRNRVSSEYLQSAFLKSRIKLYEFGVRSAYELGQYDLALSRAELSKCRSVLRQRADRAVPETGAARDLDRRFVEVCRQIEAARPATKGSDDLAPLLAKRRALWDLLLIARAQGGTACAPAEFDRVALQKSLADDEAILYYFWQDRGTLLIALIDRLQFVVVSRAVSRDERERLEALD
jgi:hypothetical protein